MVSPITWHHPSTLALRAASVDSLSGGRLEVGIGVGWNEQEHAAFGIAMPSLKTRFDMLEESAEVLRLLWSEEDATFEGQIYSLRHAHPQIGAPGASGLRLMIGGTGERRTLPITARLADEWNAYGLTPASYRSTRAILDSNCEAIGRASAEISDSIVAPLAIGQTGAEVKDRVARLQEVCPGDPLFPSEQAPFEPEVLRENGWIAGTPSDVIEQIQAFEAEGVSRLVVHLIDVDDRASLEILARDVLPQLD